MQFTKQQKIILGAAGGIIFFFILVFAGIIPGLRQGLGPAAKLQFWGVGDTDTTWAAAINVYTSAHPNITINYTQIDEAAYEAKLVDALAANGGPDVFMFKNSWLDKHKNKITPAPADLISPASFQNLFPQVVAQDFVRNNQIYAMPLSVDTLALVYNKDIFDQKKIAVPPATWNDFKTAVLQTRTLSSVGTVTKPGAAIGGTLASMPNATDLLNLIFLQSGVTMTTSVGTQTQAAFTNPEAASALTFYAQFATPKNRYYTWSDAQGADIDSFAAKKTAMIFAYASQLPDIKAKNPFINMAVQTMPQFDTSNAVNYASYWGLAVSSKTTNTAAAWDFINYVTTNETTAGNYVKATTKPPAFRPLIAKYLTDPTLGAYAAQALTARDWAEPDPDAVSDIFNTMIKSALKGTLTTDQILRTAADSVNNLLAGSR
jgi:ABC-type glycerol-3-phosphate transport system substrate-binding protein